MYLASGSQDTYIRIYKFEKIKENVTKNMNLPNENLNNKNETVKFLELDHNVIKIGTTHDEHYFTITLETILAGHEGWVYGVSWLSSCQPCADKLMKDFEITGKSKPLNV